MLGQQTTPTVMVSTFNCFLQKTFHGQYQWYLCLIICLLNRLKKEIYILKAITQDSWIVEASFQAPTQYYYPYSAWHLLQALLLSHYVELFFIVLSNLLLHHSELFTYNHSWQPAPRICICLHLRILLLSIFHLYAWISFQVR